MINKPLRSLWLTPQSAGVFSLQKFFVSPPLGGNPILPSELHHAVHRIRAWDFFLPPFCFPIMNWNFRIVHRTPQTAKVNSDVYAIHKVYYSDDGKPEAVTEEPAYPVGKTPEEWHEQLGDYCQAKELPIIEFGEVVTKYR